MKRLAITAGVALIVGGFAAPRTEAWGQGQGNGKKGGGTEPEPYYVLQLTIDDNFEFTDLTGITHPTQLLSDGKERILPDDDSDGYLELAWSTDPDGLVTYQDHRLELVDGNGDPIGPYSDPCSQFNLSTDSSPGRARLLLSRRLEDSSRCDLSTSPPYVDDPRTYTLVFDKNDTADPDTGGSCACDKLSYLVDADGKPAEMYGGLPARTTFVEGMDSCTLTLAAGAIVWPDRSGENITSETASQQVIAWPYEDLQSKKGKKSGQTVEGMTDVHFNFRTDAAQIGDQTGWQLWSQGEIIPTANPDPTDTGRRVITSTGHRFALNGPDHLFPSGGPAQCSDVSMTFRIELRRFDLNATSQ